MAAGGSGTGEGRERVEKRGAWEADLWGWLEIDLGRRAGTQVAIWGHLGGDLGERGIPGAEGGGDVPLGGLAGGQKAEALG